MLQTIFCIPISRIVKEVIKAYVAIGNYEETESNEEKEKVDLHEEESDDEKEITIFEEGWDQEVFGDSYWNNCDLENELD